MRIWRLQTIARWLFSYENLRQQMALLEFFPDYLKVIAFKVVPGASKAPLILTLKDHSKLWIHEFMTLVIYHEIFVDSCYDISLPRITAPVVLDVGANTGLFVMRAKQLWPTSKVLCFEPHPDNFRKLSQQVSSNQLTGVTLLNKGIGANGGERRLFINPSNIGGHSVVQRFAGNESIAIEVIDLIAALDLCPDGACDLMKIDCEGAELEILMSLTPELARRVPRIVGEMTPRTYDPALMVGHLVRLGYGVETSGTVFRAVQNTRVEQ